MNLSDIKIRNILNFAGRNAVWLVLCAVSLFIFHPGFAEVRTVMFVVLVESLALALSGLAVYAYTKVDFTQETYKTKGNSNLGFIFLGVHLCLGLVVLGVYMAQFA